MTGTGATSSPVLDALLDGLPDVTHPSCHDEYRSATAPDNSSYPQHPVAVVRPRSSSEVAHVVAIAGDAGARVAVQATGHGVGGPITAESVLLDTSALQDVSVDPTSRTARVGAGATWPLVQNSAAPHGLLGLSGTSPTVGVAGYTFSGGVGWFVRKYGLSSAALRSVEFVDGSGRIRIATEDAPEAVDREALWAFRGGAAVGIATTIDIDVFPVPDLHTGYLLWQADKLPEVATAWAQATQHASESLTSDLSLLRLPPEGPFPDELLGTAVVHLSYASPDGAVHLEAMRAAVRSAATPVVDTTGPGDVESLARIHLDPPAAVPARGIGRWVDTHAAETVASIFNAARIGHDSGLNMIELRHTGSRAGENDGAMTAAPGPYLLHAVGSATDDESRGRIDEVLRQVETASSAADIGRSAPAFREGQPETADSMPEADLDRLRDARQALDPDRVLLFQRHPAP
jgi:FAD/FMN-containing dehydrogenase